MSAVSMRELLEAGVHFGHQTRRWNPKMKRFIFADRSGIYIIDLQQTQERLERGAGVRRRRSPSAEGRCSSSVPRSRRRTRSPTQAVRVGMPYVNQRWLGGLLTNWRTISERIERLHDLRHPQGGRSARSPAGEGAHHHGVRAREARGEPRRRRRHEKASRTPSSSSTCEGAACRARGSAARPAGRRARRHELRSRRRGLPDSRQRRRDPLVRAWSRARSSTPIEEGMNKVSPPELPAPEAAGGAGRGRSRSPRRARPPSQARQQKRRRRQRRGEPTSRRGSRRDDTAEADDVTADRHLGLARQGAPRPDRRAG